MPLVRSPISVPFRPVTAGLRSVAGRLDAGRIDAIAATAGGHDVGHGAAALGCAIDTLRRRQTSARVWCAGAGGLAEPLTVLLLGDAVGLAVEVIATDVASAAVEDMRSGSIPGRRLHLPRTVTSGRLVGGPAGHRPASPLQARLRAAVGDVRDVPAGGPFDLVVCRDVVHHYRPAIADSMVRVLLGSLADDGLLVIRAADALAAGRPLSGRSDVVLRKDGTVVGSVEAFVDDKDAAAVLRLAALVDDDDEVPGAHERGRRCRRLLRLADDAPTLEEARIAAAAIALADGQRDLARQLLELPVSVAWEGDASTILAVAALRDGEIYSARALLARAQPTSWLAPYLMGCMLRRLQRSADAAPFFRLALGLLDGEGIAPAGSASLEQCGPDAAAEICRSALRARPLAWHGP